MRFKGRLKALAKRSLHPRSRHAAVVAYNNTIIEEGWNRAGEHAEIAAIQNARRRDLVWGGNPPTPPLAGATLYTLMLKKDGSVGNGAPCSKCMAAIAAAGIRKVVVYLE